MEKIIVSGSRSVDLAKSVADKAQIPYLSVDSVTHSLNELYLTFTPNYKLRDMEVILFQGVCHSVNDAIIELMLLIDIIKRYQPKNISAVLPYMFYSRQDKDDISSSQGSRLIINLLSSFGIKKLITLDMHSKAILSNIGLEVINLKIADLFATHIQENYQTETTIVAPDKGSKERAKLVSSILNVPLIELTKTRKDRIIRVEQLPMSLEADKHYILIDDIIDTGSTLCEAAKVLYAAGARRIITYCTHGILQEGANGLIENSRIDKLYISDSLTKFKESTSLKIHTLSIVELLTERIKAL
ncbi:MAG: ribose-phosphate pyrophosphokinae [Rickettsiaceae bacterium]|jgi:ribose-phosphate pyrophosphokinase|nr:ribose-phosphate pyrophosphokinae [Rickettsiaceae bacterium]